MLPRLLTASSAALLVSAADPEAQAKAMLAKMSLDEKILMVHGSKGPYTGNTPEIVNTATGVRIPPLNLNDGPQGYREGGSTCWPSALTVGASFDVDLARAWGESMGKEFFDKGANIQLGPGMCLARVPRNGRNFEYVSGEDPFLGATMVGPLIEGIQSVGVIANAKHYVMNNQETDRGGMTSAVDERTRFEMYYPPFEAAARANVGSIMCSYNRIQPDGQDIQGNWSCENWQTLKVDYKQRMGFKGFVMSDWGATHSTSIERGLDQEMPGGSYMGDSLKAAVQGGTIPEAAVDDSVLRILTAMYTSKVFDNYAQWTNSSKQKDDVTSPAHSALARKLSAAGTVLLKNDNNLLPLNRAAVKKIAMLGTNCGSKVITNGGGSGHVTPTYVVTPCAGVRQKFDPPSATCSFVNDTDLMVYPSTERDNVASKEDCCAACFAESSCVQFTYIADTKTCWMHDKVGTQKAHTGYVSGSCGKDTSHVTCNDSSDADMAATAAIDADVAIVFVGSVSSEGSDRTTLAFDDAQVKLAQAVAAAAPGKTIVVALNPGAALLPFDEAATVLTMFMPGLEVGNAFADILFGDVAPTGRLPLTMPNVDNEIDFTTKQWPGVSGISVYSEKLLVGYRWYNAHKVTPKYCFGHGLSYTTFVYSGYSYDTSANTVSVTVKNDGSAAGAEVAQLYLTFPSSAGEPPLQLKGFKKTAVLKAGESATVSFPLDDRTFSVWNADTHGWEVAKGDFTAHVGASSCDLRVQGTITK